MLGGHPGLGAPQCPQSAYNTNGAPHRRFHIQRDPRAAGVGPQCFGYCHGDQVWRSDAMLNLISSVVLIFLDSLTLQVESIVYEYFLDYR